MRLVLKFLAVALLYGCIQSGTLQAARDMPEFSLPTAVDGEMVSSDAFAGQAMLITFFATWCPPCRQEIPTLKELHREYGAKGFSVLGISVDEKGPKVVRQLIAEAEIDYPVLMADRSITRKFGGIVGIPTSFLVNRKGQVVKSYPGYVPHAVLKKDIESVL